MPGRSLGVIGVRFFPNEDGVAHHTDKFQSDNGACYLRRGQEFHLVLLFAQRFDPRSHRLQLAFGTGPADRLQTSSGLLPVAEPDSGYPWPPAPWEWGARRTDRRHDRAVAIKVVSPTWLPVGQWELKVRTELSHLRSKASQYTHPDPVYFLFNPWNKEDDAYMEESTLLNEYVLSDFGHVWSSTKQINKPWDYGQFEKCVLPALELALKLHGHIPHHIRGSAAHVSRAIARIGREIVAGRWDDAYNDGTRPQAWEGSTQILEQYLESHGESVRYGQCWVFAGVAATFCRALGLPARMVTNWNSGHDGDFTLTVDVYLDEDLEPERTQKDMVWNYHCWTDVWMRRPELSRTGHDYDGWQVVDATYNVGPAPVKAIHDGDTHIESVSFVFPEVNGDYVLWMRKRDGTIQLLNISEKMVGFSILSDAPFSMKGQDITGEYKPPEGSESERLVVSLAANNSHLSFAKRRRRELESNILAKKDVLFNENNPKYIEFGEEFEMTLDFENDSDENRTITVELIVDVVTHYGNQIAIVKTSGKMTHILKPRERKTSRLLVDASEYAPLTYMSTLLRCRAKGWVHETDQAWHSYLPHRIEIAIPQLVLELDDELQLGRTAVLRVSLDRTVGVPLTGCQLQLGGSALESSAGAPIQLADLYPGERFYVRIRIEPVRAGERQIVAKLTTAELPTLRAWLDVAVAGAGAGGGGGWGEGDLRARNFREHLEEILSEAFDDHRLR